MPKEKPWRFEVHYPRLTMRQHKAVGKLVDESRRDAAVFVYEDLEDGAKFTCSGKCPSNQSSYQYERILKIID